MAEEVTRPGEPTATASRTIRGLTILASGLTAASIAVNLLLQVMRFLNKRPVQPDQRDRIQTAGLALTVLKTLPGLIKQVRLLADQVRTAK